MRTEYDIQTDITKDSGKGKCTKTFRPSVDFFPPKDNYFLRNSEHITCWLLAEFGTGKNKFSKEIHGGTNCHQDKPDGRLANSETAWYSKVCPLEIKGGANWTNPNMWIDPVMKQKTLYWQEKSKSRRIKTAIQELKELFSKPFKRKFPAD